MTDTIRTGDALRWQGRVRIEKRLADGTVQVSEVDNLIVDGGLDLLRDALRGTADAQIRFMAWGDSSGAVSSTQEALGNETGRKQVTSRSAPGTGELVTTVYMAPFDGNVPGVIEEFGWFGGVSASTQADSGVMIARILHSDTKTDLESIQVDRTDTIGVGP